MNSIVRLTHSLEFMSTALRAAASGHPVNSPQVLDAVKAAQSILGEILRDAFPIHKEPLYTSPVPAGFDTILGYLSKNQPDIIELMEDPIADTQRDGYWLMHRTKEAQILPEKVKAPACCLGIGITEVNAYPVWLLEKRFG